MINSIFISQSLFSHMSTTNLGTSLKLEGQLQISWMGQRDMKWVSSQPTILSTVVLLSPPDSTALQLAISWLSLGHRRISIGSAFTSSRHVGGGVKAVWGKSGRGLLLLIRWMVPGGKWARLWDNLWQEMVALLFASWIFPSVRLFHTGGMACTCLAGDKMFCDMSGSMGSCYTLVQLQELWWKLDSIYPTLVVVSGIGENLFGRERMHLHACLPLQGSWEFSPTVTWPAEGLLIRFAFMWQGNHRVATAHKVALVYR